MTLAFLLLAAFTATWGLMVFAMVQTHPAPSQTPLIPQFLFCAISTPLLLVAAALVWLLGG